MDVNDLDKLTVAGIRGHVRAKARAALRGLGVEDFEPDLDPPPDPAMGDLGFPCFALAKVLRRAPQQIAQQVAEAVVPDALIQSAGTDKAYVNFRLDPGALVRVVVGQVLREGDGYGGGQAEPARHWMVEYSAPNTNKPLHLGHLRNNLLGASISRILGFHGHRVTRINLVNDRGVHICKSMLAYQRWGEGTDPEQAGQKGDHLVGDFYVRFDREFRAGYEAWQRTDEARARLATWLESKKGQAEQKAKEKGGAGAGSAAPSTPIRQGGAVSVPSHPAPSARSAPRRSPC